MVRREIEPVVERTLARRDTGSFQRSGTPLTRAEASAAPAITFPADGTRIRRRWEPGGGGTITTSSGAYKTGFRNCVDELDEVPTGVGTMVRVDQRGNVVTQRRLEYVRIDMQEFTDAGWLNIQCQAGNFSMAGILCPTTLPLATIQAGLRLAIANNAMYTWVPDEPVATGKNQGGGKNQGKGGGKGGGGKGGKGGGGKGGGGFQTGGQQVTAH